ncbi:hypothetical protein F4779DRAFT_605665 [Xylariaceae sp. FL0662B]|nr:hypothetical protein F4779DRAFT_605665 [Xylariaceae sp. FL0662B]
MQQAVEKQINEAGEREKLIVGEIYAKNPQFCDQRNALAIPEALWEEYEAFCESIEPQFSSRGGWSLTCTAYHHGSYVRHDPDFVLFKESAEMPYTQCNFRCEPCVEWTKKYIYPKEKPERTEEYVVTFWPRARPNPTTGGKTTWGELYPELYELAVKAVRSGSEAAMDMLTVLPDQNASFNGGWLFEYAFEESRKDHPVKSRQWSYRSAHKIDSPVDKATKRKKLELSLRPELFR